MARKPAAQQKPSVEDIPIDQSVEIDVDGDQVVAIVDDTNGATSGDDQQASGVTVDVGDGDSRQDGGGLRQEVEALKTAEEISRRQNEHLQRQLEEQSRRTRELEEQNSRFAASEMEAQFDAIVAAISAAEAEAAAATREFTNAAANGDYDAQAAAQRKISRAEARLENLEAGKSQLEGRLESVRKNVNTNGQQRPVTQTDPFEQSIAALPDSAKNWLRSHREYMTDHRKNAKIQVAHWDVLDEGHEAYSPSYYDALEVKLGLKQKAPPVADQRRGQTVSAPVSRETVSTTNGKPVNNRRVTLDKEQREIARASMPHLTPAEAERVYAENLLKLQELKRQGHYQER